MSLPLCILHLTVSEIANILKVPTPKKHKEICIDSFAIDSRKVLMPKSTLFVALSGQRTNGHKFIDALYKKGCRAFLVERLPQKHKRYKASFFKVNNTLLAYQTLAKAWRKNFTFDVLAITGSSGKTIVKEWLYELLREEWFVYRSPQSYNSKIGVPLSVFSARSVYDLSIFEAAISEPGEMNTHADILSPEYGIFTGIGPAHQSEFESLDQKIKEKLLLFKRVKCLFLGADDHRVNKHLPKGVKTFTYSFKDKGAAVYVKKVIKKEKKASITLLYKNKSYVFSVPFSSQPLIENAILSLLPAFYFKLPFESILPKTKSLPNVHMRLEEKIAHGGGVLLSDEYNLDPASLPLAFDQFNQLSEKPKRLLVLSDYPELTDSDQQIQLNKYIKTCRFTHICLVGKGFKKITLHIPPKNISYFKHTEDLLKKINGNVYLGYDILIKGSRNHNLERVTQQLSFQKQQTTYTIDLNALVHNYRFLKQLSGQKKVMAIIKAFGYGAGAFKIAKALAGQKVDYFGVAYIDEGVALREKGIQTPIMVMNPTRIDFQTLYDYNLEPTLHDLQMLDATLIWCSQNKKKIKVHIEFDTGMRRLGFSLRQYKEVIKRLKSQKRVQIASVFSHLVASDKEEFDVFSKSQKKQFTTIAKAFALHFKSFDTHLYNSAAVQRFNSKNPFSMVRIGLALHGITQSEFSTDLKLVGKLRTTISKVTRVKKEDSVSYNRSYIFKKNTKVATLAIGYADGLPKITEKNNLKLYIEDKPYPVVGDICMDMCMIDIGIDSTLSVGDQVDVFVNINQLQTLSKKAQTIPYEVITGISKRVKRVYVH